MGWDLATTKTSSGAPTRNHSLWGQILTCDDYYDGGQECLCWVLVKTFYGECKEIARPTESTL